VPWARSRRCRQCARTPWRTHREVPHRRPQRVRRPQPAQAVTAAAGAAGDAITERGVNRPPSQTGDGSPLALR
jgi:hypothetical protein